MGSNKGLQNSLWKRGGCPSSERPHSDLGTERWAGISEVKERKGITGCARCTGVNELREFGGGSMAHLNTLTGLLSYRFLFGYWCPEMQGLPLEVINIRMCVFHPFGCSLQADFKMQNSPVWAKSVKYKMVPALGWCKKMFLLYDVKTTHLCASNAYFQTQTIRIFSFSFFKKRAYFQLCVSLYIEVWVCAGQYRAQGDRKSISSLWSWSYRRLTGTD